MGLGRAATWLFLRNTSLGKTMLGTQALGKTAVGAYIKESVVDSRGRLKNNSGNWTHGDLHFTVDQADDREAPGGWFVSVSWPKEGGGREHTTILFDKNGYIANAKSNRKNGWI